MDAITTIANTVMTTSPESLVRVITKDAMKKVVTPPFEDRRRHNSFDLETTSRQTGHEKFATLPGRPINTMNFARRKSPWDSAKIRVVDLIGT